MKSIKPKPKTIDPHKLQTIIGYQELCKKEAPVTMVATFRISELEELIRQTKKRLMILRPTLIANYGKINRSEEYQCHTICITFVREKFNTDKKLPACHSRINSRQLLLENSIKKNKEYYTQIIPIISGCISDLDNNFHNKHFEYIQDKSGNIPFVHPGGEGTGLIPPPPTGNAEETS